VIIDPSWEVLDCGTTMLGPDAESGVSESRVTARQGEGQLSDANYVLAERHE
jgi:hypothetical protein